MNSRNVSFNSFITASPARASRFDPNKEHGTFEKVRVGTSSTIRWDSGKGALCASALSRTRNLAVIRDLYPECYDFAILMYDKLSFHRTHYSPNLPDPIDMLVRCIGEGPKFAESYSDSRKLGRFQWLGMHFVQPEDEVKPLKMQSYYDSYDVSSFIFWTENSEDYKWMRMGVPEVSQDYLDMITEFASDISDELLSDNEINEEIPLSLLNKPTASGGFNANDPEVRTIPEWSLEFDDPSLDGEIPFLICKRSEAPKRPGETRDIGIMDPRSMRTHRRFMWNLQRACSRLRSSPHGKDRDRLIEIINWITRDDGRYYMRDYSKSGMTVPHSVIRALLTGFYRRCPKLGELGSRWYEGSRVYFDELGKGEYFHPDTGCPLGLFVEGYTLLQYCIHRINLLRFEHKTDLRFSGTNDDMVVSSQSHETIQTYIDVDMVTNSNLGMAFKASKSGWAKNFVYCEEYVVNQKIQKKDSLYAAGVLSALLAVNIVQAKDHVYSILLSCPDITDQVLKAVKIVQSHFGHEFVEAEKEWPYLFGGWYPQFKDGLDHSVLWYDGDDLAKACYWACREDIHVPKKYKETPSLCLGRKFGVYLCKEPEGYNPNYVDMITLFGTRDTLARHYMRSSISPKAVAREYAGLLKKRLSLFKSYTMGKKSLPDPLDKWLERHPNSYIPEYLPGVKFGPVIKSIPFSTGLPRDNFLGKLCYMIQEGYILARTDQKLRPTHRYFLSKGLSSDLDGEIAYIPPGGISEWVLRNQPRGLKDLWERKVQTIVSVGDSDTQLPETLIFLNGSKVNLVDAHRYAKFLREWGVKPDTVSLRWIYDLLQSKQNEPEEPGPVADLAAHDFFGEHERLFNLLKEMTSGMLGEVTRHVSEVIQSSLEPQGSSEQENLQEDPVMDQEQLKINVLGQAIDSDTGSSPENSEDDSGFGDVWDELGVG
jgi:hypothetical protein